MNWAEVFGNEDARKKRAMEAQAAKRAAKLERLNAAARAPGLSIQCEGGPNGIYYKYDRGLGVQGKGRTARAAEMQKRGVNCIG